MATRNRTRLFAEYRQASHSLRKDDHRGWRRAYYTGEKVLEKEKGKGAEWMSLLDKRQGSVIDEEAQREEPWMNEHHHQDGEGGLEFPPEWVDSVDEMTEEMAKIKIKMKELEVLHQHHLLPGFEDRSEEERTIELVTRSITSDFYNVQKRIKNIVPETLGQSQDPLKPIHSEEFRLRANVQISLAQKLQELSSEFKKAQSIYLKRMKGRETRNKDVFSLEDTGLDMEEPYDTGFTSEQVQRVETSERLVQEREKEIKGIARSIQELAEILRELQVLVIDQGTVLDRIDYTIEKVNANTTEAVVELKQTSEGQKKSRTKLCILLLMALIGILFIILIFKIAIQ